MDTQLSVDVATHIDASPDTVFACLTNPTLLTQWHGSSAELEPHPGGIFRVVLTDQHTVLGHFQEVRAGTKLVIGWGYESGEPTIPPDSTRLTFLLSPKGSGTELHLQHEGLPTQQSSDRHADGWRFFLDRLGVIARQTENSRELARIIEDYVAAWNEDDADKRRLLLQRCWADDGEYIDTYGPASGIHTLDDRIGSVRQMLPGARLVRTTRIDQMREYLRFGWSIAGPDSIPVATGVNIAHVQPDGRLGRVLSFGGELEITTDGSLCNARNME